MNILKSIACNVFIGIILIGITLPSGSSHAIVITDFVGDNDGLGGRLIGDSIVPGQFNFRSSSEAGASDGSQFTDSSAAGPNNAGLGRVLDFVDFLHTYSIEGGLIVSATLTFGIGSMQSNDNNPSTKLALEDGLFVDGLLIEDAFEPLDQAPYGYDIFSIDLPSLVFAELADGSATVRIDSNSFGGTIPQFQPNGTEPIYYDFSKLEITTIPVTEPGSLALFGISIVGLGVLRHRRRTV
ncbi:MAG: PEP-CTERM sorting domain-containing protein [Planctomycetaceae bacterium]|jgi:hypothetical protein|nr:PEP-CTERM sorting domain-containing protein [Planctomycetaceae bacterium]